MRLVYAIRHVGMTGGVKVFFQHVRLLRNLGHEVHILTRFIDEEWDFGIKPQILPSFEDRYIPEADGIVVTTPKDVEELWTVAHRRNIPLFHFLQGFEPDYVLERINGAVVPERFHGESLITKIKYQYKIREWNKRLERFDRLYRLPTVKIAIAPHLVKGVEERYHKPCYFLPNGIDTQVFYPKPNDLEYSSLLKILSVGNYNLEYKAIKDVIEAVRLLKNNGHKILFTRVSPADINNAEIESGVVDDFHVRISEAEIARLYRESHFLVAASTEIEGFGLPPVEAMSTGTPVILTRITPFLAFDNVPDYAYFVNVHKPQEIAQGIREVSGNEALRRSICSKGRQVALKYDLAEIGRRLEKILRDSIEAEG